MVSTTFGFEYLSIYEFVAPKSLKFTLSTPSPSHFQLTRIIEESEFDIDELSQL